MGVNGIYGLSGSGLDIESMVKVGMMGRQNEYDKMAQKYTQNEWKKAEFINLNSQITTFNMSTLSQYKMSASMNSRIAESSSDAVKVSANATAGIMSHKVKVKELSSNAYLLGTNKMTRYDVEAGTVAADKSSLSSSVKLADVLFSKLEKNSDMVSFNLADIDLKAADVVKEDTTDTETDGTGTDTIDEYKFNNLNLTDIAFRFTITDGTENTGEMTEKEKQAYIEKNTISYTYAELLGAKDENGNDLAAVTFNDLVSKINGLGTNIRASYDSVNDTFSFYNSKGGTDNQINFSFAENSENVDAEDTEAGRSAARNFFSNMGLYQSVGGELYTNYTDKQNNVRVELSSADGKYHAISSDDGSDPDTSGTTLSYIEFSMDKNTFSGINGKINVDGVDYTTEENKVTVGGITYSALNEMSEAATVSVAQDVDSIVDKVKSFVSDYNKLLSSLYEKYDEKNDSNYKPLTQAQKDAMTEEQVNKWEEKAKQGLLYHDSTLAKIIGDMRNAINATVEGVEGKYNSAYSIGISTTGIKGQLTLDETRLRNALSEDADSVYNVFAKLDSGYTDSKTGKTVERSEFNGIAQRLGDVFTAATKAIRDRAGSSTDITEDSDLNNLLRELQTKMSNFKKMMSAFEDALYKKYDAMESALSKLGTQLNFITGSFQ